MKRRIAAIAVVLIAAAGLGYGAWQVWGPPGSEGTAAPVAAAEACGEHDLTHCPFCHPEVIPELGYCGGHGVPEALCSRCRPELEAAFRAEGDWCGGHGLPESQCELCNPGILDGIAERYGFGTEPAGAAAEACAEHDLTHCPFCHPGVIPELGFCGGHGVPEALCSRCRPELEAAFRAEGDWCGGHGLPESQCEQCNPGILDGIAERYGFGTEPAGAAAEACGEHDLTHCPFCHPGVIPELGFCGGHGVPEALCSRCRPELEAAFRAEGDWCGGHGLPESQCELCNPGILDGIAERYGFGEEPATTEPGASEVEVVVDDAPRAQRAPSITCTTENSVIRLRDAEVARRIGLEVEPVRRAPLNAAVEAPAETAYDARRQARLSSRAEGIVAEVAVDLGHTVAAGDTLVVVDSSALGTAKSRLLQAAARVRLWERNHERQQRLLQRSLATESEALEAETNLVESRIARARAEQQLRNLGLDDEAVEAVVAGEDTSSLLHLRAPFAGEVVALDAVVGQVVDTGTTLVAVADPSRMWAMIDVAPADAEVVAVGQPVLLDLGDRRGDPVGGTVTWVGPTVDPRTRTVAVRAEFDNAGGRMRARSFGRARIVTRAGEEVVLVPKTAVQWEGCCNVAFVRRSATEYAPHKLHLGHDAGDHYEVLSGLDPGDEVVTTGSYLLKTELRKGSIGAGCCEVDHLGK